MAPAVRTPAVFERYVNSKDNQTLVVGELQLLLFERYVNSKDNQTILNVVFPWIAFERYVNSKDNQTPDDHPEGSGCLRDM